MATENSNVFSITGDNAQMRWPGGFNTDGYVELKYNGQDVIYVPKSFVNKGFAVGEAQYKYPKSAGGPEDYNKNVASGGNATWFGNLTFLDQSLYPFMKPANLGADFIDQYGKVTKAPTTRDYQGEQHFTSFDMREVPNFEDGYIIEKSVFDKAARLTAVGGNGWTRINDPARIPDGMGVGPDGKPAYIGYTEDRSGGTQRYDLFYVNAENSAGRYEFKWSKSLFNAFPALRFVDIAMRVVNPFYNLGRAISDFATGEGKIGDVALALVGANTPNAQGVTAAKGTMFEIPQIANATSKIADFYTAQLGLSPSQAAAAAKVTFDTGLGYLANGQNFEKAFANAAAGFVGSEVGGEVGKLVAGLGPEIQKITQATTGAATRAALLNEDVGLAAKTAFVSTAIPIAINGAIKSSGVKIPAQTRDAAIMVATELAMNPDADIEKVLSGAVSNILVDAAYKTAVTQLRASGISVTFNPEVEQRLKNFVKGAIEGRDPSQLINAELINAAANASAGQLKDWTAQQQGWDNWASRENAQRLYGKNVTPAQFNASATAILNAVLSNPNVDESALQAYVDAGYFSKEFVTKAVNKEYADLVNELDKRVTNESEAKEFFKDAFGREATTPEDMEIVNQYLNIAEDAARGSYYAAKLFQDDLKEFVYDGSNAGTREAAEAEAKARGYNTYMFDGETITIMPQSEVAQRTELVGKVLAEQGKTLATASDADIQRAVDLISKVPQGSLGGASIQDIVRGDAFQVGWKGGRYYFVDGSGNPMVLDPETGETAMIVEISGVGQGPSEQKVSMQDLATSDPEAYLQMASQLDDTVIGDLSDFFSNSFRAATLAAQATGNKTLIDGLQSIADKSKQPAAIVAQGFGEQVESIAKFFASVTGTSYDTNLIRSAQALKEWGAANQSKTTKEQEESFLRYIAEADGVSGKLKAIPAAIADNPLGFLTLVAKEGVQQVLPLWAARGVMALGKVAAYSTNAAVEGAQVWGSSASEVYDDAIRAGKSENEARAMASKAGFQGFVVAAVGNGVGDIPVVRKIIGDSVSDSFGDLLKGTARESVTEYFEELLTNANNQRIMTGEVNWDQAVTAATIGAGVGAGTTAGIMTGLNINRNAEVARDLEGNPVTLSELLSGTKQVDMRTVNMSTTVGTAKDGDTVTLGGLAVMPLTSGVSYDLFATTAPSILTNQNIVLGKDALGNDVTLATAMGQVTDKVGFDQVYNNLLNTTNTERTQAQKEVIEQSFKNAGYNTFTAKDVESLLNVNNPGGTQSFVTSAKAYAAPRVVESYLKDAGYTATPDEIETLLQQAAGMTPEQTRAAMDTYADSRVVSESEARAAYEALGLSRPTEEDVRALMGQYDQGQLGEKAEASLDRARYNSIMAEIDRLAADSGVDPSVIDTIKNDLNSQIESLGGDLEAVRGSIAERIAEAQKQTGQQVADLESRVSAEIQAAYDALNAEQKALADSLTQQGVDLRSAIDVAAAQGQQALTETEQRITGQVQQVADLLGKPTRQVTQADIDLVNQMVSGQQQVNTAYDANQDGKIDQADIDLLTRLMAGNVDVNEPWTPAAGTVWAPTGLFAEQAAEAERTRQAQAAEAERTRRAQADAALKTQRMGNINTMLGMLAQSPDIAGRQVTVKAPDPTRIGYIYDFNSIFANPAQEQMFVTPFSQPQRPLTTPTMPGVQRRPMGFTEGGQVRNELDDVNDELLKMLKG